MQPDGGEGLAKRKDVIARWGLKEAWSKAAARWTRTGSRGLPGRTSEPLIAKSTAIKDRGGKSGGRAVKAVDLTSGDLRRVSGLETERAARLPPIPIVRPAWASTWRWKSSRERVIASEANRRASFREAGVKEAGSEAAGRRTGIGYLYSQSTNLGRYHYVPRPWSPRPGQSAAVEDANCHPSLQFQSYDSRNDKERTKIRVWSDLARDVASK